MFTIISICNGGGYRYCRTMPIHPKANSKGLYPLHRVLIENKLNRLLRPAEIVHHLNGNKSDDSDRNLGVMRRDEHSKFHSHRTRIKFNCAGCGRPSATSAYDFRLRKSRSKLGVFCSNRCSGIASNKRYRREV